MNSRLDTIQAAILQVKFKAFKEYELEKVNAIADIYTEQLKDIVKVPMVLEGFYSSWAQYTIQLENRKERDDLQKKLRENNIPSMVYYAKAMHEQQVFERNNIFEQQYIQTNCIKEKVLSIPIHSYMGEKQIEQVVNYLINKYAKGL